MSLWRFGTLVNCPAVCMNHPACPAQPVQGTEAANSCCTARGRLHHALATPAALFRSVPQDSQQCPRADHCTAHRDEGAPHKESPAQLPEADVCCHHGCVAVLVPETAPASAAGCSPSQSLPAVWGRHSPAHQEITSDNSGKHVCYPFMRASNPGPNSGCAKRFSPEEMCLLINIY